MPKKPYPILAEISNSLGVEEATHTYESVFSNRFKLIDLIEAGLSVHSFIKLKSLLPFSTQDWASFLNISSKSLQRYEKSPAGKIKPAQSERIVELAEVSFYGIEVFGTKEKFHSWVTSPSADLGGRRPLDVLSSSYGKELVIDLIGRIDYGIFA